MRHLTLSALAALAALAGCGGGSPSTETTAYPSSIPAAGDWFLYSIHTSFSDGTEATAGQVLFYPQANADGSLLEVNSYSEDGALSSTISYDASQSMVSRELAGVRCTFASPFRVGPALGTHVGESFSRQSSPLTCSDSGPDTALLDQGQADAVEEHAVPLGTFRTFKYHHTTQILGQPAALPQVETCWVDLESGRPVECIRTYNSAPINGQPSQLLQTVRLTLTAYRLNGQPVAPSSARFAGRWRIDFAAGASIACSPLQVDLDGTLSAACDGPSGAFTLTGSVDAEGTLSAGDAQGVTMSGTLATPVSGEGRWSEGGNASNWSAHHL